MAQPTKHRALGRGLSALLPQPPRDRDNAVGSGPVALATPAPVDRTPRTYFHAQIEEVYPSPEQPRRRFAEDSLENLTQTIREHGIIQPLVVRKRPVVDGSGYYLIAGERRWRAAQRAGLHEVPVIVQDVDSKAAFERAIVENVQRTDLNPIEEAEAYSRLASDFGYSQNDIADRVGKDRSTVANAVRLLKLPRAVREMVEDGRLSMGHARALLGAGSGPEIERAAREVVAKGLSVRATEKLVQMGGADRRVTGGEARGASKSAAVKDLENRLTKSLGAAVEIQEQGSGGAIQIRYLDLDDLDRLLARLL